MSGYDIFLSNGSLLTTINVKTVDVQQSSSLYLIGQGIPDYGTMIAQDYVWMLENFAKSTPPVHPLNGQIWYNSSLETENFYNGSVWQTLLASGSVEGQAFVMLQAASGIDFTLADTTTIFTGTADFTYFPTQVFLVPQGSITATAGPTFNLYTSSAGDILANTTVSSFSATTFARYPTAATPKFVSGTNSVNLQVTTAATGGLLSFNVYLFGFIL